MINLEKKPKNNQPTYDLTDVMLLMKIVLSMVRIPENILQTLLTYQETKLPHNV